MLTLNLIPQQLKKAIKFKRVYALLKKMNCILIIIAVIVAIILLIAKLILQNNFNKVVEQTSLITKSSQGYNVKVRDINSRLNQVLQIQKDFIAWSDLIEDLANRTPDGITFSSVKINKEKSLINIRGNAKQRDDLLMLKQNMEESLIYSEVEFPLQNILQKENINFDISAKLNLDEF
ncbi:PilN domain-containing protein [Candidatus Parcubacteria bacterium]|nr:PilN domain-containing protein [Candidatus Parcubacteria bacterium]